MSSDYPLEIKYHRLWEWLDARSSVLSKKKDFKDVRSKAVALAQLVRHEAAGLRKHIQKAKRDVAEGERREELHGAAARRAERDLQQLCTEYGVDPEAPDYTQAVGCHAAASLASRVAAIAAALPADAAPGARVYAAFVAAEREGGGGGGGGGGDADGSTLAELLPTLAFVLEHSTHHTARVCLECLRTKTPPTEEAVAAAEAAAAAVAAKGEGAACGAEEAATVEKTGGGEVIEVDWGMLMHDGGGGGDNADGDGFCCELVEEEEEGAAADDAAATGSAAATDGEDCPLLLSSECRTLLLDDLHELLGFLEQRQEEGDIRAAAGVAGVGGVVALLEDDVLHELVDVAASGAALQRAAQRLARRRTEVEKMAQACLRDRDSVHDATERHERAAARLAEISLEAKPLKAEIEERMGVWHAPRIVYLVGDVEHI